MKPMMSSPGQRIAALGVADEHVVDAVEADAAVVAPDDLADEPLDAALRGCSAAARRALPPSFGGEHDVDDVARRRSCRSRCR